MKKYPRKLRKTTINTPIGTFVIGDAPAGSVGIVKRHGSATQRLAKKRLKTPTRAEKELERILNTANGGAFKGKFQREWAFAGKWILDFFFYENRLGIEVDGSYHSLESQRQKDQEKANACKKFEITLIRLKNEEIFGDQDALLKRLREGHRKANDLMAKEKPKMQSGLKKTVGTSVNIPQVLRCSSCGYERILTPEWLESIGLDHSLEMPERLMEDLRTLLPRFTCSKCKSKDARIVIASIRNLADLERQSPAPTSASKQLPKRASGPKPITIKKPPLPRTRTATSVGDPIGKANERTTQESKHADTRTSESSWSKKTCPYCGGDGGPGGRCFSCYGTGWVEALF